MPKYLVTSGSHFEPFTYDELVKPVVAAQQAQDQTQQAYDALALDTESLRRYISDSEDDRETRALYDNYMDKLNEFQDDLYNNGYSPKAKRSLSEARRAYASDISRIAKAVETRQQRSKEYWDTKHKNPDMIMGTDPGTSGLDAYMNDDMYGQNYYTYSGADFEKQMAQAAKARANEIFNAPQYLNNPAMQGYKLRIDKDGFTNAEVDSAVNAIRYGGEENLDVPSRILYDTMLNGLVSTGAKDNVSPEEYDRLIEFGRSGLSQAVGSTKYTDIQDRAWKMPTDKSDKTRNPTSDPDRVSGSTGAGSMRKIVTPGYRKLSKNLNSSIGGVMKPYEESPTGTVGLVVDDSMEWFSNPFDAGNAVYNTAERQNVRRQFGGVDIAMSSKQIENLATQYAKEGDPFTYDMNGELVPITFVRYGQMRDDDKQAMNKYGYTNNDDLGVFTMNNEFLGKITDAFNRTRNAYNRNIERTEKQNPDLNKKAITPKQSWDLRNDYKVDRRIDDNDLMYVTVGNERVWDVSEPIIMGTDKSFDNMKSELGRAIRDYVIKHEPTDSSIKNDKTIIPIKKVIKGSGGFDYTEESVSSNELFGEAESSKTDLDKFILSATALPEDILNGVFRFTTYTNDDEYVANIDLLGPKFAKLLEEPMPGTAFGGMNLKDAISYMMTPIVNPSNSLTLSDAESELWGERVIGMLSDQYGIKGPTKVIRNSSGEYELVPATLKDVVRNWDMRTKLHEEICNFIQDNLDLYLNNR